LKLGTAEQVGDFDETISNGIPGVFRFKVGILLRAVFEGRRTNTVLEPQAHAVR